MLIRRLIIALGALAIACLAATPAANAQTGASIDIVDVSGPIATDEPFQITFRVVGSTADRTVRIALHDQLVTRAQIQTSIEQEPATDVATIIGPLNLADLATGDGLHRVEIVPEQQSPLLEAGSVHPVQLALEHDGRIEDAAVLFVVVAPASPVQPMSVAVVAPITAPPMLTPDGQTIVDPATRRELEAIADALVATQGIPVTLRATPETLVGLLQAADERSLQLVDRVKLSLRDREVLTSPFVRIDTEAWTQSDHTSEFAEQIAVGTAATRAALDTAPTPGTWFSRQPISAETVTALGALGLADRLVIPSTTVSPLGDDSRDAGVGQRFELLDSNGVGHPAITADPTLASHFDRSGDAALDGHHLLVELGWLALESPDVARGVVVDPPDRWAPDADFLTYLLAGITEPLLTATTVTGLFDAVSPLTLAADPDANVLRRSLEPLEPPGELPLEDDRADAQSAVVSLDNLTEPSDATAFLRRLLLTSASADLSESDQAAYLSAITVRVDRSRGAISTVGANRVTLSSRNGPVPISIRNSGNQALRAVVSLTSDKLEFPSGPTIELTLEPGVTELQPEVRARTSGDATLDIVITSPDRGIELDRSRLIVRSTALSGVGVLIAAVASAFLLLWWLRNRRSSGHTGDEAEPIDSTLTGTADRLVPGT